MLKYYIKVIIRNLLKVFWIFPIDKKKIYFQSFGGKSMNCNPWYIFKYMYEKYPDYKYVWLLNKDPENRLKGVTYVKKNTFKWVKEILTSKIIINNIIFNAYFPYRLNQILIQTWHGGGAYKTVNLTWKSEKNVLNTLKSHQYSGKFTTYYISSCESFSKIMATDWFTKYDKFIHSGMPRNDVFFNTLTTDILKQKVQKKYNLSDDYLIVLYAPTYRGYWASGYFKNLLDISKIKNALEYKYNKKTKILYRGHYCIKKDDTNIFDFDINVSSYPEMQDLLCAADILITDYSSSMWDFSFLYRPCFLYTPDIQEYINDRGFYTDPYSWGFPICKSNEELVNAIEHFDKNKFVIAMRKHHKDLGAYENGKATEKVVECILHSIQ